MPRSVSVILPARSHAAMTSRALTSLALSFSQLNLRPEFILINDQSDDPRLAALFAKFQRDHARDAGVRIATTLSRFHYSGVLALGLALASGDDVFFFSNDMVVTPAYVKALLAVGGLSRSYGVIRGTSNYTDSHPEHAVAPDRRLKTLSEIQAFSARRLQEIGDFHVEDRLLSGDAILIKREVLEAIGGADPQFYGYFGDVDFGLRAQIAGFKLICAKGAWLLHEGAGYIKHEARQNNLSADLADQQRQAVVRAAFETFARKWRLPAFVGAVLELPFEALRAQHAGAPLERLVYPEARRALVTLS